MKSKEVKDIFVSLVRVLLHDSWHSSSRQSLFKIRYTWTFSKWEIFTTFELRSRHRRAKTFSLLSLLSRVVPVQSSETWKSCRMEEKDFVGTAIVVRRLERWKLRTSDGLEVGLMGMINIEKSVANGFSPSVSVLFSINLDSPLLSVGSHLTSLLSHWCSYFVNLT